MTDDLHGSSELLRSKVNAIKSSTDKKIKTFEKSLTESYMDESAVKDLLTAKVEEESNWTH